MAILITKTLVPITNPVDTTMTVVNNINATADMTNLLFAMQAPGTIENRGTVFTNNGTIETQLTSNLKIADGDEVSLIFRNWEFFFVINKTWVKIEELVIPIADIGTTGVKYIYINYVGDVIIADTLYTVSTPAMVRLARISFSAGNLLYTIMLMPEFSSTPKLLRAYMQQQPALHVVDAIINPVAGQTQLARLSTKIFAEGVGALKDSDHNMLIIPNATPVDLIYVDDSNMVPAAKTPTTTFDTSTYIPIISSNPTPINMSVVCQLSLAFDGSLVVQHGTTVYNGLSDAVTNMQTEVFPAITGDVAQEYIPIARIAYKHLASDLVDTNEAVIQSMLTYKPTGLMWSNF